MANEREEGLTALQNGDFATAQAKLEAAIAQNPQDAQAHLYLGGVYHQQQRDTEAARVLTRATELLPMSSQAQYNLGIALEALGSHPQALDAYRKATALQDNYPLAQQGIERMQKALQAAPPTGMYGTAPAPTGYEATANTAAYAPPAAPAYQSAPTAQSYMQDQTQPAAPYAAQPGYAPPAQPGYAPPASPAYAPPVQPGYAQPNVPPGYAQPTAYGEPQQYDLAGNPIAPTQPAYGQAAPGMAPPPPGPAGYQGQQWSPYPAQGQMAKEDRFDLVQAFKDWGQILISPLRFFDSERGAAGFSAPMAQTMAYILVIGIVGMIMNVVTGHTAMLLWGIVGIPLGFLLYALIWMIWGGINHGISRMFGGSGEFSGSFRASVYAAAPFMTMVLAISLLNPMLSPKSAGMAMADPQVRVVRAQYGNNPYAGSGSRVGRTNSSASPFGARSYGTSSAYANPYGHTNPLIGLMGLIGMIWSMVLMVFGVRATQNVETGSAVGTVILSVIVMGIIFIGIAIVLGAVLAGFIASVMPH